MTVTIWVSRVELERFYRLVTKMETVFVPDSEIREAYLGWGDLPQPNWLQVQINYTTYIRLIDAGIS